MTANFGDVFETVAAHVAPETPAILCDGEIVSWRAFDCASNALARTFLGAGLSTGAKVALMMRNGPDYLIAFSACFKARLSPVNINYRYGTEEVRYLLENSDSEAIVFDAAFADTVAGADPERVRTLFVARGEALGATPLESVYARNDASPLVIARRPDDSFLLYTGGTTGMPRGVIWPSEAAWGSLAASRALPGQPPPMSLDDLVRQVASGEGRVRYYIAPPLMHGTGLFSSIAALSRGGSVVLSGAASFDPDALIDSLARHSCDGLVIVGDAFARPILDALKARATAPDLSRMQNVASSGMMWSPAVKLGLLEYMPNAILSDAMGASESSGMAIAITARGDAPEDARFELAGAVVLDLETLKPVEAGSGKIGILAKTGYLPAGYYKDPERTARAYVEVDGARYVLGGDHALLEADGAIRLLGRGSHCINTAGEKVYPEEVEEALKTHPAVSDALVFATPHPRFGQAVTAIASASAGAAPEEIIAHVRARLAAYKAPRRLAIVATVPRLANGKADYPAARALFDAQGVVEDN